MEAVWERPVARLASAFDDLNQYLREDSLFPFVSLPSYQQNILEVVCYYDAV